MSTVADVIRRVIDAPTHHGALGIAPDAPRDVIIASYRRMCLALHPDKCDAPGAREAFHRVQAAHAVLTADDPEFEVNGMSSDELAAALHAVSVVLSRVGLADFTFLTTKTTRKVCRGAGCLANVFGSSVEGGMCASCDAKSRVVVPRQWCGGFGCNTKVVSKGELCTKCSAKKKMMNTNVLSPAAADFYAHALHDAMQSCDVLTLERALASAEGAYSYQPDHVVLSAKQLLHVWYTRVRGELDALRASVAARYSKQIIHAIHAAQLCPHHGFMRLDIIAAKSLLSIQEQAMREVGTVVESRDAIAMNLFLKRYREALPEDVLRELTDLRRKFVKVGAASSPRGIYDVVDVASARLMSTTPPRREMSIMSAVYHEEVSTESRESTPPAHPHYFDDEVAYLDTSERSVRCEAILRERHERIGIVKVMVYDLHRVRERPTLYVSQRRKERGVSNEEDILPGGPGGTFSPLRSPSSPPPPLPPRMVPEEQYSLLCSEMQSQQWQYVLAMHASQLCLTYEKQRAERFSMANEELTVRFALFAAHHTIMKYHIVESPRAHPTDLEKIGDQIAETLRQACVSRGGIATAESSEWIALEQPALAALWVLYNERME